MYDFKEFEEKIEIVISWIKKEFSQIRGGAISTSILDGVDVDSYGNKTKLSHVASLNLEGASTMVITPWDKTLIQNIESTLRDNEMGFSLSVSDNSIKVNLPDLTQERREIFKKIIKEKHEEAKQSIRGAREKVLKDTKTKLQNKEISEDESAEIKKELQELVDKANKKILELTENKLKEIDI